MEKVIEYLESKIKDGTLNSYTIHAQKKPDLRGVYSFYDDGSSRQAWEKDPEKLLYLLMLGEARHINKEEPEKKIREMAVDEEDVDEDELDLL